MSSTRYYSNGKLLLTGEYVVLDGAKALALPTVFGQNLTIAPKREPSLSWQSLDSDGSIWFADEIQLDEIGHGNHPETADSVRTTLIGILHEAQKLNPSFLTDKSGFSVQTALSFPRRWGLGTSSTLINNIAQWANVDAFTLLRNSFGGSGYDIACAQHDTPIIYQLVADTPQISPIDFRPAFADDLYFVYLNRKQSSKAAIAAYYNNRLNDLPDHITTINRITERIVAAENMGVFARKLAEHESAISNIIEMKTVGETFFPDFDGVVKSLGGWGGDFILAVSDRNPSAYFRARGFDTIVPYREMILGF
ncbi:GHMP kinase [Flavobacterium longum]|uniref:GYDIA family GHMP kinase n=1 Tax=Flavobacterium longum TaxID=1299340 RepID=UPI0039EBBF7F